MANETFDKALARHDVAVKGIFLLWKWGRWALLRQIFPGIPRREIDQCFQAFDEEYIEGNGRIITDDQVFGLVKLFPPAASAAVLMVGVYQMMNRKEAYG